MINLKCLRAETSLQRRAAGLSSSDALQLEEHLAGCQTCNAQAQLLSGFGELVAAAGEALDGAARTRAITSALATAQPVVLTEPRASWLWPATAFAAACGVMLVLTLQPSHERDVMNDAVAHRSSPAAVSVKADHVLAGAVQVNNQASTPGAAITDGAELSTEAGASVALAQATVQLRPQTAVRWNGKTRELRLQTGSVLADVDPSAHRSFSVHTDRFSVIVLGTQFEVSERVVSVTRGRVRVVDPSGGLLALLEAGQRFDVDAAHRVAPPPQAEQTTAQERRPRADAAALLGQARVELASRQVAAARRTIDAVLQLSLSPPVHAEALSLRADCALVEGDKGAAADAYLRVAERFAKLPAGENALFAAARLRSERGDAKAAKQLLSLYLSRYPAGHFVKEASGRLRDLGVSTHPAP